jgi:glutamine amidotransferase-like uncharacterized protein
VKALSCSCFLLWSAGVHSLSGADIAIYNDTDRVAWPDGGAWLPLVTATQVLAEALDHSWEFIDADDVNDGDLSQYQLIFFPGGWAGGYNAYIEERGYENIREFISEGGAYMGMCAGAFFASDQVFWRENIGLDTPQNVYDYPLDIWPGIADGVILDFQPWNSSFITGCTELPGARMVDLRVDPNLMPESEPVVNVLYYGGPIFRPPGGKWTNELVIARYDMDGLTGDEEPAMILFPYGKGRVFLSAVHPELSLFEPTCELYYEAVARTFLGQIIARMLAPQQAIETDIEMSRMLRFDTVLGRSYQIESSADAGDTWQPYGAVIEADSLEHIAKIPASDDALEFRIVLVE